MSDLQLKAERIWDSMEVGYEISPGVKVTGGSEKNISNSQSITTTQLSNGQTWNLESKSSWVSERIASIVNEGEASATIETTVVPESETEAPAEASPEAE